MHIEKNLIRYTFHRFFWPALLSSVTLAILPMTDLLIAGHVMGDLGLGAVTISLPIMFMVELIKVFLCIGGAVIFSSSLGKGDFRSCSKVFTMCVVGSFVSGILLGGGGLLILRPLAAFLGASPSQLESAVDYMGVYLLGIPFFILASVFNIFLRNDSKPNFATFCVIFCALINVVTSIYFAVSLNWGLSGIAAGSVVSQVISCLMAGIVILRKRKNYGLVKDFWDGKLAARIFNAGVSIAVIILFQVILSVVINRILRDGDSVAVYGVVKSFINFMFVGLFEGVTSAMQPMLGIYYGEGEGRNLRYTAEYGFAAYLVMSLVICLALNFGAPLFCSVFGMESPSLRALASKALRLIGFYSFSTSVTVFLEGFYRCVGKEKVSMLIVLIDSFLMHPICIFLFVYVLHMGDIGVFYAITFTATGTLLGYCLYCRPFRKGMTPEGKVTYVAGFWDAIGALQEDPNQFAEITSVSQSNIAALLQDVQAYCEKFHISEKKKMYIVLCVEELIVNVAGILESQHKDPEKFYADVKIHLLEDGSVKLRIRDNLTEWTPKALDLGDKAILENLDRSSGVNEMGFGIIFKIAKDFSYKRTIGLNNFSVVL